MNEQPNTPMSAPSPGGISSWFSVWMKAMTKPGEQTFASLATSGNAKASTAYLWVFIGSLVNIFLASLVQGETTRRMLQQFGLDAPAGGGGIVNLLVTAVCGAPIGAVIVVIGFAILTGIVQWIAKMFGGKGTFDQLAYGFAAILTPVYLVSGVLSLLSAIPFVGLCFSILSLILFLYVLFLEVAAVKGVNQFGWGQAAGSVFIPLIVIFCCVFVGVFGMRTLLGPKIGDTFSSINNSLP